MPSAHNERRVNYRQEVLLSRVLLCPLQVLKKWLLNILWILLDSETVRKRIPHGYEVKVWERELNQKWPPSSTFSKNEYVFLNISDLVAAVFFPLPLSLFKNLIFSIYQRHSGQSSEEYVLMWWDMRMREEVCRHFCGLMGQHISIQRVGKPRLQSLPLNCEVLGVPLRLLCFNFTTET